MVQHNNNTRHNIETLSRDCLSSASCQPIRDQTSQGKLNVDLAVNVPRLSSLPGLICRWRIKGADGGKRPLNSSFFSTLVIH